MPTKEHFNQVMLCVKSALIGRDRKERFHTHVYNSLEKYRTKIEMELMLFSLFPSGKIAAKSPVPKEKHAMRTIDFVFSGAEIILNATFINKDNFLRIPLIKKVNNLWEIYHTNDSFSDDDLETITNTLGKNRIAKVYNVLLNQSYKRQGALDLESLFVFKEENETISDKAANPKRVIQNTNISYKNAIALDINTFASGIPLFNNSRPHQFIPFQFTAVKKTNQETRPSIITYIGNGIDDPRESLIQNLIQACGEKSPIIVFSDEIEIQILEELAMDFPKYKTALENIQNRIITIEKITETYLYNETVKRTTYVNGPPLLIPDYLFEEIPVNNHLSIQETYKLLQYAQAPIKRADLISKIQDYCIEKTMGLYHIYDFAIHNKNEDNL